MPMPTLRGVLLGAGALCLGASVVACPRAPTCAHQTIVFYDHSASAVVDHETDSIFRDWLRHLPDAALTCPGDGVHGFLVHGQTTAKVGRVDENASFKVDTTDGTALSRAQNKLKLEQTLTTTRNRAAQLLLALPGRAVSSSTSRNTDLLGSLQVIRDEMQGVDTTQSIVVYYFSDMRESMPAPGRNFDTRPPKDNAEAEAWADQDRALLKAMKIEPVRFAHVHVRVLMGNLAAKPKADEVRAYWERLFRNAGVSPENIRYN